MMMDTNTTAFESELITATVSTSTTSFARIVGATATILITTLDDCVWLVPYLASTTVPLTIRVRHAAIFAFTLIGLTSTVVAVTYIFQQKLSTVSFVKNEETYNMCIEAFGAILCWILAGYYYYKSWRKRQRRKLKQKEQEKQQKDEEKINLVASNTSSNNQDTNLHEKVNVDSSTSNYGTCNSATNQNDKNNNGVSLVDPLTTTTTTTPRGHNFHHDDEHKDNRSVFQPWTIVTLTISGALDEISYFPSLLLGHIFTGTELIIGTVITVLIMLCIVTQLLQYCQPLLHCLDQIPLYGIITLYAILLTVNLIIELVFSSS